MPATSAAEKLCLACGLCCNGVLFADVQLQPTDDAARLRELGVLQRGKKFPQPCAMHDGCRCAIYHDRPQYCRQFECLLLKQTQAGRTTVEAALRLIKRAKSQAARVGELLEQLGDTDVSLALSKRFQKMRKQIESDPRDPKRVEWFGLLTVAVHELNVILSESFYR